MSLETKLVHGRGAVPLNGRGAGIIYELVRPNKSIRENYFVGPNAFDIDIKRRILQDETGIYCNLWN